MNQKSTGIVRKIDDLGRIVLPAEKRPRSRRNPCPGGPHHSKKAFNHLCLLWKHRTSRTVPW